MKRLVWFTVPLFVLVLSLPSAGIAAAAPTPPQLETVAKQIDVLAAAGAISPGIGKSLNAKVEAAARAIEKGDGARADRIVGAFRSEVEAQSGRGIATSAAELLTASVSGEAATTVFSVPVGSSAVITTQVGESPVVLALPSGTPVAWIRFGSAGGATIPQPSGTRRLVSIEIDAFDAFGRIVHQLGANAEISIGFQAATSVNVSSARISTLDAAGSVEKLVTRVTSGADATTATASTSHLSPFVVDALSNIPPWRFTYVAPPTITGVTPSSGSVCGNTTIVMTGSGLSGDVIPAVRDIVPQSFTVDSDTQITMLSSVGDPAAFSDVSISKFLTSTALAPEFANTRIDVFTGAFALNASAGTNFPGTPTYSPVVQPVTPRISGLTPNQGPTIGAPAHPSQDFTNPAIRITGCGFSGATQVLFGLTASPSFTVQDDAIIFALPPTPGSGTVDIRVVTPLGTSSIVP
ncbi:MAG: IPT/TIG domain-containing protein [Candidatus Limnocylindria bacterium]